MPDGALACVCDRRRAAGTVSSWLAEERLQWLTIWQTEPNWMFPRGEFRFQLTTNYCEACLLEDAATTGVEFLRLNWLLAPQTICPRHLTFLREMCRCCNREVQPRHWRSKTKFILNFAGRLRQDILAVEAAVTEQWSNGVVEGQVNRLKTLKRQMYGRAGVELIRARMIPLPPEPIAVQRE